MHYAPAARPPKPVAAGPRHIAGLDAARFLAAFGVMAFHLFAWSPLSMRSTGAHVLAGLHPSAALAPWAANGWIGVQIFFVISGAVIAFSAERSTPSAFARSRVLRLAPAAWICATISLLVSLALALGPPGNLFLDYLRSVSFFPVGPYIDGVYWTLGIEIVFYALVFVLLSTVGFSKIEWLGVGLGLLSAAFLFATIKRPYWFYVLPERALQLSMLRYGIYFAMGVALWASARRGLTLARIAFLVLMLAAASHEIALSSHEMLGGLGLDDFSLVPFLLFTAGAGAVAASILFSDRLRLRPQAAAALRIIGLATYPLYLIHQLGGAFVLREFLLLGLQPLAAAGVAVATCVAAAVAIAIYCEPPLRALLRRALAKRPALALDPVARQA